jgi:hypothetical protein
MNTPKLHTAASDLKPPIEKVQRRMATGISTLATIGSLFAYGIGTAPAVGSNPAFAAFQHSLSEMQKANASKTGTALSLDAKRGYGRVATTKPATHTL